MRKKIILPFVLLVSLVRIAHAQATPVDVPWPWYTARAAGLVAFMLLYISIFLGLTIRLPWMRKFLSPVYSLDFHRWLSLQATLFAFLHAFALFFDKLYNFSLTDLFVPFVSRFQPGFMTMGIIGFYLMVTLVVSSYLKKYISYKIWRGLHSLNIILYFILIGHALNLGTDLKSGILRSVFIWSNVLLMILFLYNLILRFIPKSKKANA